MAEKNMEDERPFEEVVIDAIKVDSRIFCTSLGLLILRTKITRNHDEIIKAVRGNLRNLDWTESYADKVINSVLEKKRIIEEREKDRTTLTEGHRLDALMAVIGDMASLASIATLDKAIKNTLEQGGKQARKIADATDDASFREAIIGLEL
jgi:hypothetical protein